MASIFSQIINGDLPGHFVWKDELAVAFMTIKPIMDGHLLVVPREEINHWDDVPADTAAHLMNLGQKVAKGIKAAFPCKRVGVVIAGLEVPHTHIHLMPVNELTDFDFSKVGDRTPEQLADAASKIRAALVEQGHNEAQQ